MLGSRRWATMLVLSLLIVCLPLRAALAQSAPEVSARLSAPRIAFEESVTLEVIARGVDGELDTQALQQEFDITGRSESQQVRIVNGVNDSLRQWILQLVPKRTGQLTVPPVSVGGVASQALVLEVGDAPTGADRLLFMELNIDVPRPWVQQQVYLTLSVFHRIALDRYQISAPEVPGVTVLPIDGEITRTEQRDGVTYNVLEKRFALFPQESGVVVLPPFVLTALVPTDPTRVRTLLSPTQRVTRRTDPVMLDVQARPDDTTANWWLPSRSIDISHEWQSDLGEVRVGEPISRLVRVLADGVLPTQLPTIDIPDVDGVSVYIDEPEDQTRAEVDGLVTERVTSWAVIPQRAGELVLPEILIEWFDTVSGEERVARIPEQTLEVQAAVTDVLAPAGLEQETAALPAELPESSQAPAGEPIDGAGVGAETVAATARTSSDGGKPVWRWVALVALAGWGLTGAAWLWRERRARREPKLLATADDRRFPGVAESIDAIQSAAGRGDLAQVAEAIRAWVRATSGRSGYRLAAPGLTDIAARREHAEIADDLRALDARLYGSYASRLQQSLDLDLDRVHRHFVALATDDDDRSTTASTARLPSL